MNSQIISGSRSLSYVDLDARVSRASAGLHSMGVGRGDAIALLLRNDFVYFEATLAASALGAYAVPINWHFKEEEIQYIAMDSTAKLLVVHSDLLSLVSEDLRNLLPILVVDTPAEIVAAYNVDAESLDEKRKYRKWDEWRDTFQPWCEKPSAPLISVMYTSGTTGRPKGVRRKPPCEMEAREILRNTAAIFGISNEAPVRTVVTGPMYHGAPNVYAMAAVRSKSHVVLQPRFDAQELLTLIERHKISHLHMVPTMFLRLLALPELVRQSADLSSLRFVVHAAAPCPPEIKRRMIEWWGPVINEYYGGTESGAIAFHSSEEALRKPGTVGRPLRGATIKILGTDGSELAPGEVGEIYMHISSYPDFEYIGRPGARSEIEVDGLISCGDMGYLDRDGYLFLRDRSRDMVISGGVNIYPAEIESALAEVPGVVDSAVFGIPDAEFGEKLLAVVQVEQDSILDENFLRGALAERLANYKIPKHFKFADSLPRDDSGKLFKRKLRDPYWAEAGRHI